jgi:SAM-dependent methyltransferase
MANVKWMDTSEARETAQEGVREIVRERYSQAAKRVQTSAGAASSCGGSASADSGACCSRDTDPITGDLYTSQEAGEVPTEALLASLGCGNPTALAKLNPGETVLDLGSGGGIDVLLSARRVGPTGFAYGLDMTDEMLALAEENKRKAGVENVRFLKGYIEDIPLPDNSVDVIISNCVINLAADKAPVLREAFRVLKPGGRFAVSDIVVRGNMPTWLKRSMEAWTGCIAGALHVDEYTRLLGEAGFENVDIEVTRTYSAADIINEAGCCVPEGLVSAAKGATAGVFDGLLVSAFVRAIKPVEAPVLAAPVTTA